MTDPIPSLDLDRQRAVIEQLGVRPVIDPQAEIEARVSFLADYVRGAGGRALVLGLSSWVLVAGVAYTGVRLLGS